MIIGWEDDVLGLKLVSPVYFALIKCEPIESDEVSKVACPEFTSISLVPPSIGVNPSMKIILPEGFSALRDDTLTLAVSIILALRHFLWIRRFSVQDRIGFYERIMRISI